MNKYISYIEENIIFEKLVGLEILINLDKDIVVS